MTFASGIGSLPGDSAGEYADAVKLVLSELPGLPHLPELPGRGVTAGMTGRALALVTDLGVDLQPAGWRLTDASGIDHRRARSLLGQDLDALEEAAQGYEGAFKIQVAGPWTLAATVEKPRGDKVLSDHGARRDLAQALAEGLRTHVADVRRRVPGLTSLVVQVDEPALPAVLGGKVPTASGFGRHRTVHPPEASQALEWVLAAAGDEPIVHCCADDVPIGLIRGAGAKGIAVDLDRLAASSYDDLAESVEAGDRVLLGVVPTSPAALTETSVTERVARLLDMLGLEPTDRLVVTPACGLAGATPAWARTAYELCAAASRNLTA